MHHAPHLRELTQNRIGRISSKAIMHVALAPKRKWSAKALQMSSRPGNELYEVTFRPLPKARVGTRALHLQQGFGQKTTAQLDLHTPLAFSKSRRADRQWTGRPESKRIQARP